MVAQIPYDGNERWPEIESLPRSRQLRGATQAYETFQAAGESLRDTRETPAAFAQGITPVVS